MKNYEVKKEKDITTVVFNKYEYLHLYDRKNGERYYETYGMSADTWLKVEKWLNDNGYQYIGFEK